MTFVFDSVASWISGGKGLTSTDPLVISEDSSREVQENDRVTASIPEQETHIESDSTLKSSEETDKTPDVVGVTADAGEGVQDSDDKDQPPTSTLDVDLQEVSEKAYNAAKEWGSYFFNVGKAATQQVAKTAKQLKDTVEEKTILGEFSREQEKFLTENREKKKLSEAAVPPWVGYNEEELMKTQILALSKDKRNLLRNPPAGVQFFFDYESSFPIALVMLEEDPNLKAMRFELVPKQIKEELFWRNYFYRVSLIKQSTQLTSLAQQSDSSNKDANLEQGRNKPEVEVDDLPVGSPPADHEFVSDAFQSGQIPDDDLRDAMNQLGVDEIENLDEIKPKRDDIPDWEKELQAEIQEYEVVDDDITDADIEHEIMKQLEAESKTSR